MKKNRRGSTCLRLGVFLFVLMFCPLSSCQTINSTAAGLELPQMTIILSFDDGPNSLDDSTARLLELLDKYRIKAMFSLLGINAEYEPDIVRLIHEQGHLIINHGYYDKWAYPMGKNKFRDNLLKGEAAINAALGTESRPLLYRPHGGYFRRSQEKIWRKEGYTIVSCNARAYDAILKKSGKDRAVRKILNKVEKQGAGIILLHDAKDSHVRMEKKLKKQPNGSYNRSWIPDATEIIITALLENGYTFTSPAVLYSN